MLPTSNYRNYSLQNAVKQPNTNFNPYGSFGFDEMQDAPYMQNMQMSSPYSMNSEMSNSYSYPSVTGLPSPYLANNVPSGYKSGGMVKSKQDYHHAAEMLRRKGQDGDTILAHINPIEAAILKNMGGSGTINPATGLPQFKPWYKHITHNIGSVIGSIVGNMIAPGIGGPIGGAIGQGIQDKTRGKSFTKGAGRGALIAAALPTAASAAGSGLSAMGAQTAGSALSSYGTSNAILPALGFGNTAAAGSTAATAANAGASSTAKTAAEKAMESRIRSEVAQKAMEENIRKQVEREAASKIPFTEKLMTGTKDFFSKPENLLSTASTAGTLYTVLNQNKEKSPERLANEAKRYRNAMMLTPEEMSKQEAQMLAEAQMKRRVARKRFTPEDRLGLDTEGTYYARTSSPEEYSRTGRWINYYDNPAFTGAALQMKKGGNVMIPHISIEEEIRSPGLAGYLMGATKGQDDMKDGYLVEDDFVIPADVVADIGDGNNIAGAKMLENHFKRFDENPRSSNPLIKSIIPAKVSDGEYVIKAKRVMNMGGGKAADGHKKLYNLINNVRKEKRGGKVSLPPKAKPLSAYMTK